MSSLGIPPDMPFAVLVESAAKGTLVLLGGGLVAYALGRASAALRHLVWALTLGSLVMLPVLLAVGPRWRVAVPAAASRAVVSLSGAPTASTPRPPATARSAHALESTPVAAPAPWAPIGENAAPSRGSSSPAIARSRLSGATETPLPAVPRVNAAAAAARAPLDVRSLLLGVWFTGFVAVLASFVLGHLALRLLLRGARPLRDADWQALALDAAGTLRIDVPFLLLQGGALAMPVAFGILRPRVLLPAGAAEWPADRRRAVLLHELAHVKRHDCLTQALAQLACATFWFHPAAWFAAHRMRVERERACDDLVLAARTRATDYADHLLEVARTLRAGRIASFGAVAFARPSQFEGRLLAVLDPSRDRSGMSAGRALPAALAVVVVVATVAAFQPVPRAVAAARGKTITAPARAASASTLLAAAGGRDEPVRRAAIAGLAHHPTAEAASRLAEIARDDDSPAMRQAAVEALREHGTAESLEALFEIARDTRDDEVLAQVFSALGEAIVGADVPAPPAGLAPLPPAAPEPCVTAAPEESPAPHAEPTLAPEAVERALERSVERRIRQEERRQVLREKMRQMQRTLAAIAPVAPGEGGDDEALRGAIEALSRYPEAQSFPRLREIAESYPNDEIRALAVESLAQLGTPAAMSVIQQLAWKSTSEEVRGAAIDAIAHSLPAEEALPILLRISQSHPEESARSRAVDALADIDDPRARAAMGELVEEGSPEAQKQAVACLGRDHENALAKLLKIARTHASEETRRQAVETLGRLDDSGVLTALIRLAKDGSGGDVARQAAESIGHREEPDAVHALVTLTRAPAADEVQEQAVRSLGHRDENAVPRLLLDLVRSHPSPEIQRIAVECLGQRDDIDVMQVLGGIAAGHPSPEMRRQAVDTMSRVDPDAALPMLEKILKSKKAKKHS